MTTVGHIARKSLAAAGAAAAALILCAIAAAAAPTAITGPVTATAATTATLSGTVNPNGTATSWHFDYGKTTTYGTSTSSTSAGSGTANTGVSANLTGLTPGTTYHYRLVATSTGGTTNGSDGIFNTASAAPPTVTTNAATGVGSGAATLNGSINANGQATTYYFEYGKTTSYGTKTGVQNGGSDTNPVNVSAAISGLQSGQTYHFRLVATSTGGTTNGNDASFTASSGPSATTKAASSITSSSAKLNGSVIPNGLATSCFFDYGTSTSYGSKSATVSAGSGTKSVNVSATVTGLGAGIYHFRVSCSSTAGTSTGSDLTLRQRRPARRADRLGPGRLDERRDPHRLREPAGQLDELVLPVRAERLVRLEDLGEERGIRHRGNGRLGRDHEPEGRHDLPLPPRRHEQRRHDVRQRRHVHDRRRRDDRLLDGPARLRPLRDAVGRRLEQAVRASP